MLVPAIQYEEALMEMQKQLWFDDKYMYWNSDSYYELFQVEPSSWAVHQFVSVKDNKLIGYIGYRISRADNSVISLNIMNFDDNNKFAFGVDLSQALRDIFERYRFHKLVFHVIIGNPIESSYDKLVTKFGGRIVGTFKEDVKLTDGMYHDKKFYEVLASDYFNSVGYHSLIRGKKNTHNE